MGRRWTGVVAFVLFAAPALAQRLPPDVVPEHYDIAVEPDLAAATFAGVERIRVTLGKPSSSITLNAAEIQFRTVTATAGGRTQDARVVLDAPKEQATITVPETMPPGTLDLNIEYSGILNDQLRACI